MNLKCGMQLMHDCKPMELLYQTHKLPSGEIWMVKLLFIDEQVERHEIFKSGEVCTLIHGNKTVTV